MPDTRDVGRETAESSAQTEPGIYLTGGTDELYLEEEGRVFYPGDRMPRTLTNAKRVSLQSAGIRFETRHAEPEPEPKARISADEADPETGRAERAVETRPDDKVEATQPRRAASKE
jgi:hypothetical protein